MAGSMRLTLSSPFRSGRTLRCCGSVGCLTNWNGQFTTPSENCKPSSTVVKETLTLVLTIRLQHGLKVTKSRKRLWQVSLLSWSLINFSVEV